MLIGQATAVSIVHEITSSKVLGPFDLSKPTGSIMFVDLFVYLLHLCFILPDGPFSLEDIAELVGVGVVKPVNKSCPCWLTAGVMIVVNNG